MGSYACTFQTCFIWIRITSCEAEWRQPKERPYKNQLWIFCDYDIVLGLKCVLPMSELVQSLSKMLQAKGTFNQVHCVWFVYHVCRPSRKVLQPLISNLQHLGEPYLWCFTYCVVVGTIDSNWAFDIQSFIIGCLCYTRHIKQLERCLWWTWLIGNM